ncbi:hypothetical protein KIPB_015480, partial [Kipferlia bialata]
VLFAASGRLDGAAEASIDIFSFEKDYGPKETTLVAQQELYPSTCLGTGESAPTFDAESSADFRSALEDKQLMVTDITTVYDKYIYACIYVCVYYSRSALEDKQLMVTGITTA